MERMPSKATGETKSSTSKNKDREPKGGGGEEPEEVWEAIPVIQGSEKYPCMNEGCKEPAVTTWATNLDPYYDYNWLVCEDCQLKALCGWPAGAVYADSDDDDDEETMLVCEDCQLKALCGWPAGAVYADSDDDSDDDGETMLEEETKPEATSTEEGKISDDFSLPSEAADAVNDNDKSDSTPMVVDEPIAEETAAESFIEPSSDDASAGPNSSPPSEANYDVKDGDKSTNKEGRLAMNCCECKVTPPSLRRQKRKHYAD
jgi:hypothetical protein